MARTQIPLETTCLSPGSDRSFLLRELSMLTDRSAVRNGGLVELVGSEESLGDGGERQAVLQLC